MAKYYIVEIRDTHDNVIDTVRVAANNEDEARENAWDDFIYYCYAEVVDEEEEED